MLDQVVFYTAYCVFIGLMIVYPLGYAIMVWRPFFVAMSQGKMVTEVYTVRELLWNLVSSLAWPFFAFKKTG